MNARFPRNSNANEMTHAHWVAAWWSRAISQIAAQAACEKETVSVETLLVQFLNANKIAIDCGTKTAWAFDKHVWDTVGEKANRKEPNIDVRKEFTVVDENTLSAVQKMVQHVPNHAGGKGGKSQNKGQKDGNGGKGSMSVSAGEVNTSSWKGGGKNVFGGKGTKSGKDAQQQRGKGCGKQGKK